MKRKNKKTLRKWLIRIAFVELFAALYVSGALNTLFSSNGASLSPIAIIRCYGERGFPVGIFFSVLILLGIVTVFVLLNIWGKDDGADPMGRKFTNATERQVYGDSHFEEPEEYEDMAVIQSPQKSFGTILGQLDETGKYLINLRHDDARTNHHIMVVGATGSGKTFTFAKDYCLQTIRRRESAIITDPDGGLTRDMATSFFNAGYVVRVLNLKDLSLSDGWDCLKTVRSGMLETTAHMFAHIVISNIMDAGTQSIYKDGPESLLTALILRCMLGNDVKEEDKNIGTVYSYLMQTDATVFLDSLFDETQLSVDERACLGPYQAAKSASANLWGNLVTNLAIGLNLLQSKEVSRLLTTDDIDLTLPGKRPCVYFCQFPDSHDTFKFVVALFFSMLFINLVDFADKQDNGKLPVPVNFLMDECASIGIVPDFDRKMATIRKRDIAVAMIWQNVGQVADVYGSKWKTIISNCDTFLSLGINDEDTADMVSRRIGDTTVQVETHQHPSKASIMNAVNSYSTGEGRRALLSYDELFKVDRDRCIIIFKGHNPIHAYKHPHELHPDAKMMAKWYIRDKTPIYDVEQRNKERQQEKQFLADYDRKHPFEGIDRTYANKFGSAWSDYDDTENDGCAKRKLADFWAIVRTKAVFVRNEIMVLLRKLRNADTVKKSDRRARRIRKKRRAMNYEEQDWWPDERNPHGCGYAEWDIPPAEEPLPEVEMLDDAAEGDADIPGILWESPPDADTVPAEPPAPKTSEDAAPEPDNADKESVRHVSGTRQNNRLTDAQKAAAKAASRPVQRYSEQEAAASANGKGRKNKQKQKSGEEGSQSEKQQRGTAEFDSFEDAENLSVKKGNKGKNQQNNPPPVSAQNNCNASLQSLAQETEQSRRKSQPPPSKRKE